MAGLIVSFPGDVEDVVAKSRAVSFATINGRARTPQGSLALVTDLVVFTPTTVGQWIVGNQRVRVMGTPTVGQSGAGTVYDIVFAPQLTLVPKGPMAVSGGNPRVKAQ